MFKHYLQDNSALLNKIVDKLIGNYTKAHQLQCYDSFFSFCEKQFELLNINTSDFDWVEHAILYALNALPEDKGLKETLLFNFRQTDETFVDPDLASKYERTGILFPKKGPDGIYFDGSPPIAFPELEIQLKLIDPKLTNLFVNLYSKIKNNLNLLKDSGYLIRSESEIDSIINKYGSWSMVSTHYIPMKWASLAFATNPILIAQHYINNQELYKDEAPDVINDFVNLITKELDNFSGFSNGVPIYEINKLKDSLGANIQKDILEVKNDENDTKTRELVAKVIGDALRLQYLGNTGPNSPRAPFFSPTFKLTLKKEHDEKSDEPNNVRPIYKG